MKTLKKITLVLLLLVYSLSSYSQVSISPDGRDPHPAAVMDLISNERGFLMPRVDGNNQVNDPAESLLIYNKETGCIETYLDAEWHEIWCAEIEPPEPIDCEGTFTDDRDATIYEMVGIGNQCWMAENMKYLPEVHSNSNYTPNADTEARYGVYGYDGTDVAAAKAHTIGGVDIYDTYGVLYNAIAAETVCPDGWKLPSDDDWIELEIELGMDPAESYASGFRGSDEDIGDKIKCPDYRGGLFCVNAPNCAETDFNAVAGGYRYIAVDVEFANRTALGYWWTSTDDGASYKWGRRMTSSDALNEQSGIYRFTIPNTASASVRCLKEID